MTLSATLGDPSSSYNGTRIINRSHDQLDRAPEQSPGSTARSRGAPSGPEHSVNKFCLYHTKQAPQYLDTRGTISCSPRSLITPLLPETAAAVAATERCPPLPW